MWWSRCGEGTSCKLIQTSSLFILWNNPVHHCPPLPHDDIWYNLLELLCLVCHWLSSTTAASQTASWSQTHTRTHTHSHQERKHKKSLEIKAKKSLGLFLYSAFHCFASLIWPCSVQDVSIQSNLFISVHACVSECLHGALCFLKFSLHLPQRGSPFSL